MYAKDVKVPASVTQARKDSLIDSKDTQEIHNALGSEDKEVYWIEGTRRRLDSLNRFAEHLNKMLGWFEKYIL